MTKNVNKSYVVGAIVEPAVAKGDRLNWGTLVQSTSISISAVAFPSACTSAVGIQYSNFWIIEHGQPDMKVERFQSFCVKKQVIRSAV